MNALEQRKFEVLTENTNWEKALAKVALQGYAFLPSAISVAALKAMEQEVEQLTLDDGDYTTQPIAEYKRTRVTQRHERFYRAVEDPRVAVARLVSEALVKKVRHTAAETPGRSTATLSRWAPTEVGYQRYRQPEGHISPHRDRRTDQLLGATMTINGATIVKIHRPVDDPNDYTNLEEVDRFEAAPGSLMLLRAPGLASGEQAIHEVLPPHTPSRLILNLRMRHDVLKSPSQEVAHGKN